MRNLSREKVLEILRGNGVNLESQKVALLVIRQTYEGKAKTGIWDDRFYWIDLQSMAEYEGNADPSKYKKNVATLKPGVWRYKKGNHGSKAYGSYPAYRQAAPVKVLRWQPDGTFEEHDLKSSINIHHGSRETSSTSSLGCLTIRYTNWPAFKAQGDLMIKKAEVSDFPVLVTLSTASVSTSIKKGDRGDKVKFIQLVLGIEQDGIFGLNTEKAVIAFQKKHGLVADGVVGPKTAAVMATPVGEKPAKKSGYSPSAECIDLIKSFEGYYSKAYLCPAKVWTIGYGTTVYPNGKKVKSGDICNRETAQEWLTHEVEEKAKAVRDAVLVVMTQGQFDALVSFAYNVGIGAFKKSTLLKKLNAGNIQGAANEFMKWNKGGGKVLAGLVRRREAERKLFLA